jgi:hypothetical protein
MQDHLEPKHTPPEQMQQYNMGSNKDQKPAHSAQGG